MPQLSVACPLNNCFKRIVWNLEKANFEGFRQALQSAPGWLMRRRSVIWKR